MKIYLAGPDVFRKDAKRRLDSLRTYLEERGFTALIPLDNDVTTSLEIYQGNLEMIRQCDAVIANITPFRGPSCDPGTAFEIGYAIALGKMVVRYSYQLSEYKERIIYNDFAGDDLYTEVENFGNQDNLMITPGGVQVCSSFKDAVSYLRGWLEEMTKQNQKNFR